MDSMGFAGFGFGLLMVFLWGLPFLLAIWFIRVMSNMVVAQREIAQRLAGIEEELRRSGGRVS